MRRLSTENSIKTHPVYKSTRVQWSIAVGEAPKAPERARTRPSRPLLCSYAPTAAPRQSPRDRRGVDACVALRRRSPPSLTPAKVAGIASAMACKKRAGILVPLALACEYLAPSRLLPVLFFLCTHKRKGPSH